MTEKRMIEQLQNKYGLKVTIEEGRVKMGQTSMSFEQACAMAASTSHSHGRRWNA